MNISPNHSRVSVWMSTLFSILLVFTLSAQTHEVGVTIGATAYYGDWSAMVCDRQNSYWFGSDDTQDLCRST